MNMTTGTGVRASPHVTRSHLQVNNDGDQQALPKITPSEQLVLFAIGERKLYGLEIQQRISDRTCKSQELSTGSLYPILQSLEKKGFIMGEWGDSTTCGARRRYHTLTDFGKRAIKNTIDIQNRLLYDTLE
jgi:PadR family transcriptional regulator, regulatory protein PadR